MLFRTIKYVINNFSIIIKEYSYVFLLLISIIYCISCNLLLEYRTFNNSIDILEIQNKNDYSIILSNKKIINNEKYISYSDIGNIDVGYKIHINEYKLKKIEHNHIENINDYSNYLKSQKIFYEIEILKYDIVSKNKTIHNISNNFDSYLKKYDSYKYLNSILLSDKSELSSNEYDAFKNLGVVHVLTVSGLHLSILILIMKKIFNNFITSKVLDIIIIILISVYFIILNDSPSVFRILSLYTYSLLSKDKDIIKKYCISISILIFLNPYIIFNFGFYFTYIISFFLTFFKPIYSNSKKISYKLLITSLISFLISLPLVVNMNFEINYLTIIFNMIIIPLFSFFIVPLSLITLLLPILDSFYLNLNNTMYSLLMYIDSNLDTSVSISKILIYEMIIYYIVIYFIIKMLYFKNYKIFILSLLTLFLSILPVKNLSVINNFNVVDVGHGMFVHVQSKYNTCNIIIDAGTNNKFINEKKYISYLKSKGVNKIDYMINTHEHYDHNSFFDSISNNFKINNLILSSNNKLDISKIRSDKTIILNNDLNSKCGDIKFNIYNYSNLFTEKNNQSLYVHINIDNTDILITGDNTEISENIFIDNFDIDIDYLLLGHHGSSTSSGMNFLKKLSPKNVLISSSKYIYNNPSAYTIEKLKKLNLNYYCTAEVGSIKINITKRKTKIKVY